MTLFKDTQQGCVWKCKPVPHYFNAVGCRQIVANDKEAHTFPGWHKAEVPGFSLLWQTFPDQLSPENFPSERPSEHGSHLALKQAMDTRSCRVILFVQLDYKVIQVKAMVVFHYLPNLLYNSINILGTQ